MSMALHALKFADNSGWLQNVIKCPSPNFNDRPASALPTLLVIHNISLPPGQFMNGHIEKFFINQLDISADPYFNEIDGLKVSPHFLVKRNGVIVQFVSCHSRAWHAGVSCYNNKENCNDFSIGIELEGTDNCAYEEIQYLSLGALVRALIGEIPTLSYQHIVGHSDIAPGRKTDPGDSFDWLKLHSVIRLAT